MGCHLDSGLLGRKGGGVRIFALRELRPYSNDNTATSTDDSIRRSELVICPKNGQFLVPTPSLPCNFPMTIICQYKLSCKGKCAKQLALTRVLSFTEHFTFHPQCIVSQFIHRSLLSLVRELFRGALVDTTSSCWNFQTEASTWWFL